MSRLGRLILPALAGLLLLLLAVEWLAPEHEAQDWRVPPAIPADTPDISGDADVAQWTATVLARPLLAPTRRPPAVAVSTVSDVLPRLSAIIVIGGRRQAIFAASGEKPQVVAKGGEVGVYRITAVAPDKVDLLGPDGAISLRPQFSGGTGQ